MEGQGLNMKYHPNKPNCRLSQHLPEGNWITHDIETNAETDKKRIRWTCIACGEGWFTRICEHKIGKKPTKRTKRN